MPVTADQNRTPDGQSSRRPVRSRVRHGQASCADYGCTRPACHQTALRARRRRDRAHGLTTRIDPTPAATRATVLVRRGMSAQDIADASGISATLVRRLLRPPGRRPPRLLRRARPRYPQFRLLHTRGATLPTGQQAAETRVLPGRVRLARRPVPTTNKKIGQGKRHAQALLCLAGRRVDVLFAMLRDGTFYESRPAATVS
ncbi:hypothetical protein KNE206_77020 [Kitasatospora sp. NE20-6]